ncbi:hypothetical protein [Cytobacillus massiliigabonensis]|uniref:hypothetical protein n=1 Tax=Cytobacillus massiliigabonensis TaxID=1871011 RepID=UPI000C83A8AE|nr:hypothetical protein [Cytobacillus massiliigabonensis]
MTGISWFSPQQGMLTISIASYGITLSQAATQYLKGGEKVRFGISEDSNQLLIQIVDQNEEDSYSIPDGIKEGKPIRITCKEFIRFLQFKTNINIETTSKYFASYDTSSKIITVDLNKELSKVRESKQLTKDENSNNEFIQNLFSPLYKSSNRAFTPVSIEDGENKMVNTEVKPIIRYGEVAFEMDTEGIQDFQLILNLVLINDISEKLLGYFLTGGSLEKMTESEKQAIYDEDFGLLIGVNNNQIQLMCFVEVYNRTGNDSIVSLSHFEKKKGINNDFIIRQMINKQLPFLLEDVKKQNI